MDDSTEELKPITDEERARLDREHPGWYERKLKGMFFAKADTPIDDIVNETLRRAGIDPETLPEDDVQSTEE